MQANAQNNMSLHQKNKSRQSNVNEDLKVSAYPSLTSLKLSEYEIKLLSEALQKQVNTKLRSRSTKRLGKAFVQSEACKEHEHQLTGPGTEGTQTNTLSHEPTSARTTTPTPL